MVDSISTSFETTNDFTAIGDALRRRKPEAVKVLEQQFPALQRVLERKRILGRPGQAAPVDGQAAPEAAGQAAPAPGRAAPAAAGQAAPAPGQAAPAATGLLELAEISSAEARSDLDEVLQKVTARARTLAQLRLVSGVISTITTAGLIALLLGTNREAQVVAAIIGFLSSVLALVSSYLEDFSGGDGSTRKLRESLIEQVKALADARGRIKLARATSNDGEVLSILQVINGILGEVQRVRALVGLPI